MSSLANFNLLPAIIDPRLFLSLLPVYYFYNPVDQCFRNFGIVPQVSAFGPYCYLTVQYTSGVEAKLGNELTPTQVKDQPRVSWPAWPDQFYSIIMADPDVPSREDQSQGAFLHWLVGNIPGNEIASGDVLSAYIGSATPKGSGLHRYVFLVYKQPQKIDFDEPRANNRSLVGRFKFSFNEFAKKYQLGCPVAGNFYQAQYDDYVPIVLQQVLPNSTDYQV